jgi:hypothetical protein
MVLMITSQGCFPEQMVMGRAPDNQRILANMNGGTLHSLPCDLQQSARPEQQQQQALVDVDRLDRQLVRLQQADERWRCDAGRAGKPP